MWFSRIAFRWVVLSLSVLLSGYAVDGVHVSGPLSALYAGLILGILHVTVRPILLLLSLPFLILSLGLFIVFVNAAVLYVASGLVPGFRVDSFAAALVASLLISAVQWVCDRWWWRNVRPSPWSFRIIRMTGRGAGPRGPHATRREKAVREGTIDLEPGADGKWE